MRNSNAVPTSRSAFMRLADVRYAEAKQLYEFRSYDGAYYLAGYAVECALKAVISRQFQRHTVPSKKLFDETFSHQLEGLLVASGLKSDFQIEAARNPRLKVNWNIIRDWKETSRYTKNYKKKAQQIIAAVGEGPDSFLYWVRDRW